MDTRQSTQRAEAGRAAVEGGEHALGGDLEEAVAIFLTLRSLLVAVAHRILGDANESEDVVQEIWIRWQRLDRTTIVDPKALLVTMTSRFAINVSRSAHHRHETAMTAPDRDLADSSHDPAARAEQRVAVEEALRLVAGSLDPRQRAALVLHDAFGYPYGQLSDFLHLHPANTRQVVSRARRRLAAVRPVTSAPRTHPAFLLAFLEASRAGELANLEHVLAADLAG
ncbi:sigma factor-like helix-turn-helix DNA-binding protein [Kribbella sp. NPDC054772]